MKDDVAVTSADAIVAAGLRTVEQLSIVFFDLGMRILAVHGGAVGRHGYDPERIVGRRAPDVLPAQAWEVLGPLYTRALTGETVTIEIPSHDGSAIYETTFQPVRDNDGALIGGMATSRDVTGQRAVEAQLAETARQFQAMAETSLEGHCRYSPDGRLLWASPAMHKLTGHPAERLVGLQVQTVIHPDDIARRDDAFAEMVATREPHTIELRARHADGSWRWVETTVRGVFDVSGTLVEVHTTSRDTTARQQAEAAQSQWQHAFDRTTVGVAVIEPHTHLMVKVNAAFARMHGGRPEDFEGRHLGETFAPHERERIRDISARAHETGYVSYGAEHVRLDGSRFPAETEAIAAYDEDGVLAYRLGYFRDVTEQRRTETERADALVQFEASFTKAPIGMCLVGLDGRFLRVNDALATMLERPVRDLLVSHCQLHAHPDDVAADLAFQQEALAGAREAYELDKRYLRPDGSIIAARLSVSLVRDPAGDPAYFIAQIVDLTALHDARAQLAQTSARLQAILDNSPTAIYLRDLEHRWQVVNPETCRIIGLPADELLGRSMGDTLPAEVFAHLSGHDAQVLEAGRAVTFDEVAPDARTGRTHHWWSAKFPVRDEDGEIIGLGGRSLDVTDREEALRELTAARALFEAAFEHAPVGKLISRMLDDGTTEVIKCNPPFAAMVGREPADLLGRSGAVVVHPDDLPERQRMIDEMLAGRTASGELRFKHRDGHDVWTLTRPAQVTGADGETLFVLQSLDISERKQFEGQLQWIADHDALTGLHSRRRLEEELDREVARVRRHSGCSCLLLLDLDGFKHVNDSFGHAVGDELLTRIGGALRCALRDVDVLARPGGDEFAVILPDTDLAGARTVAAKLVEAVREHGRIASAGSHAEVTTSVGVTSLHGGSALDGGELLVEADIAMYQAKDAGKDQVCVYERAARHRDHLVRRTNWIGRLRQAIRDEQFVLHAQPVVPLQRPPGNAERYELLLRLRDGRGELVPPGAFLHHAERDGLVVDIDRWVLGQAVGLLHQARRDGRDLSLAVNFSARTVQDPEIADDLAALLDDRPIERGSLMIEVTETAAITNVTRAGELARQLRELGCTLALDDFGAGFASFYYLKHLVFDVLKIDGDFIDRLPTSTTDQLVVRAVLDIARGLGAEVVAERVSDQRTLDLLTELGVDYAQGHFLGRPRPLD
jgi:diguanylate cyclase (GGDEF)-like protein/PAS domain S-box-containing protein